MPNEVEQRRTVEWWREMRAAERERFLRAIEERACKASPGPWYYHSVRHPIWGAIYNAEKPILAAMEHANPNYASNTADLEFAAWARTDIPFLLSLLREREEENRRLREALAAIRDYAAQRSDLSVYVEIMYEMASDALRGEQS
jgi:hypothetical protein